MPVNDDEVKNALKAMFLRKPQALQIGSYEGKEAEALVKELDKASQECKAMPQEICVDFSKQKLYFLNFTYTDDRNKTLLYNAETGNTEKIDYTLKKKNVYQIAGEVCGNTFVHMPVYSNDAKDEKKLHAMWVGNLTEFFYKKVVEANKNMKISSQKWNNNAQEHSQKSIYLNKEVVIGEGEMVRGEAAEAAAIAAMGYDYRDLGGSCMNHAAGAHNKHAGGAHDKKKHAGGWSRRRSSGFGGLFSGYRRMSRRLTR